MSRLAGEQVVSPASGSSPEASPGLLAALTIVHRAARVRALAASGSPLLSPPRLLLASCFPAHVSCWPQTTMYPLSPGRRCFLKQFDMTCLARCPSPARPISQLSTAAGRIWPWAPRHQIGEQVMQTSSVPGKLSEQQVLHGEPFTLPESLQLCVTALHSYSSPPQQASLYIQLHCHAAFPHCWPGQINHSSQKY